MTSTSVKNIGPDGPIQTTGQKAISGTRWVALAQVGRQGFAFVVTAVLARLLSPEAYGLIGMAMVVIAFAHIFKDLGTSSAVIQLKDLTDDLTCSVFWVNVLFGVLSMCLVVLVAPWTATFYREPRVVPVLWGLSASFPIAGLSITHHALLTREMAFGKLARIELLATTVAALVAIGMAVAGMGVWSLVAQTLCYTTVVTVLLWVTLRWAPTLRFQWSEIRRVASFSLHLTGSNLLNFLTRNIDKMLIARYLGTESLGYYTLAYRLMLYPVQNITNVLGRVLFPTFARMQDDNARFRRAYLRVCAVVSAVTFPLMCGVFIVATPFIAAALGPKWMPVAVLLMILAPVGLAQSVSATIGPVFVAKRRTDWMFRWQLLTMAVTIPLYVVGLRWGVVGVALAYLLRTVLLVYPGLAIAFRLIELKVRSLTVALWPTLAISLGMLLLVWLARVWLNRLAITTPWLICCVIIPLGALTYGVLLLWVKPPVLGDLMKLLPQGVANALRRRMTAVGVILP